MADLLRFHWDFFGPDAEQTCAHFKEHLDQFCAVEKVDPVRTWTHTSAQRCTASLECDQQHLALIRDRLRPKRAERLL